LAVALAESCLGGAGGQGRTHRPVGATIKLDGELRADALLFGKAPSRIVVSFDPAREAEVRATVEQAGAPFAVIGGTGGRNLTVFVAGARAIDLPVGDLKAAHDGGFQKLVE